MKTGPTFSTLSLSSPTEDFLQDPRYSALGPEDQQQVRAHLQKADRAVDYLMGQVMRATSGRASPQIARQMILSRLTGETRSSVILTRSVV